MILNDKECDRVRRYTPRPREIAEEQIRAYIMEHQLQPYDRLPAERDMCQMWGLNRCTLRSAIARLVAEGRLFTRQGSGTRVAPRFRRTMQDLQGFSEYAADAGRKAETRLLSFSAVECDRHLASRFRRVLGEKLYRVVRLRLLDGLPVMIETSYIPWELAPGLEEHDLVRGSLFSVLRDAYDLDLDHGEETASITSATEEEAAHLQIQPGEPVFWIVSQTDTKEGITVEYCRTVGRADVVEMGSILHWAGGDK